MKLIVGLGNPGRKYKHTRHNVGFMFVDRAAEVAKIKFRLDKAKSCELVDLIINNERIILMKPLTYMNLSGHAVIAVSQFYKIEKKDIIVVYDDLDLDVAQVRIKPTGTSGGHKGMQSIIDHVNDNQIKRIRIGISKPTQNETIDYVLSDFKKDEKKQIESILQVAYDMVYDIATTTFDHVMNKYN